ncbi:MAG: V-type ATPase 116kDa subunit family protein [Pseudomonadota bacterium]
MSIARLKKVSICGLLAEKRELLKQLQALGCMHILPLVPAPAEVEAVASGRAEGARKALRFLNDAPQKRRQVREPNGFDLKGVIAQVNGLKQHLRDAEDRRDFLADRIQAVEPWGAIEFPPLQHLDGQRLWFYTLPSHQAKALQSLDLPWQIMHRDHRVTHAVLISAEEPDRDILPVPRTHVGAKSLHELRDELNIAELELEDLQAERWSLTRYIYLLSVNLADAENQASLRRAQQQTLDDDAIVAVQGWVPEKSLEQLQTLVDQNQLACVIEDPKPDEEPPTLIDQPDQRAAGADLAVFYQVPAYRSWDPSRVLVVSFCVFFAMILSDAGYGLLMLAGLLLLWRRMGTTVKLRAYRGLGLALSGATIGYGALVGSYFGLTPAPDSWLGRIHLLNVDDFDTMMRISITLGVVHVTLANLMMAWSRRGQLDAWSNMGWALIVIAGLVWWLAAAHAALQTAAMVLGGLGLLMVVLFTSRRKVQRGRDHIWRLFEGIFSLTKLMNLFGDVLSYMRLFALGLASASLAITFNGLARDAYEAISGPGLLVAALIILVGHVLNLALALMSGVVHGLRLNYIEFYKWGLPEEGTAFRKFARKEVR